jgi:3-oxoacyl-[acyl-carrier protein] reductase
VADVRDAESVRDTMRAVLDRLGGLDVLVTLAGGSLGHPRELAEISAADLDLVVDVNVKGTFLCCQAAVPFMAAAGGGSIVTTSSIGGRQPVPGDGRPVRGGEGGDRRAHETARA